MIVNRKLSFAEENREKIESLKNRIFGAFPDVEQPDRDHVALHECKECCNLTEDFANVKWQKASGELLERNYDKLPLFSPEAFNYFLPAFLIYTLNNFDSCSEVGEFTIYALTPKKKWNQDGMASYWIEKFNLFTDQQMEVIYDFLELAKQNPIYEYELKSAGKKIFDRLKAIKAAG